MILNQKKALIKRSADTLEKLPVGSLLVGLFKNVPAGIYVDLACAMIASVGVWALLSKTN